MPSRTWPGCTLGLSRGNIGAFIDLRDSCYMCDDLAEVVLRSLAPEFANSNIIAPPVKTSCKRLTIYGVCDTIGPHADTPRPAPPPVD